MLGGVRTGVLGVLGVNPARGDGVDPYFSGKAYSQRMGQGGNAAFGRGVALSERLTHSIPAGGNVDDACAGSKVGGEQLGQKKWGGNPHLESVGKLGKTAFAQP